MPTSTLRATARRPIPRRSGPIPTATASRSRSLAGRSSGASLSSASAAGCRSSTSPAGGHSISTYPTGSGTSATGPCPGHGPSTTFGSSPGSLAATAAGSEHLTVKTHHHQGVNHVADASPPTAWATDDDSVEAIESPDGDFTLGVLWHPEEDPEDRVIRCLVSRSAGRT